MPQDLGARVPTASDSLGASPGSCSILSQNVSPAPNLIPSKFSLWPPPPQPDSPSLYPWGCHPEPIVSEPYWDPCELSHQHGSFPVDLAFLSGTRRTVLKHAARDRVKRASPPGRVWESLVAQSCLISCSCPPTSTSFPTSVFLYLAPQEFHFTDE